MGTKRSQKEAWEDKSVLPMRVSYGLTCGRIVDGEDNPSAQAHALGVDNAGADQSCDGGIHR